MILTADPSRLRIPQDDPAHHLLYTEPSQLLLDKT